MKLSFSISLLTSCRWVVTRRQPCLHTPHTANNVIKSKIFLCVFKSPPFLLFTKATAIIKISCLCSDSRESIDVMCMAGNKCHHYSRISVLPVAWKNWVGCEAFGKTYSNRYGVVQSAKYCVSTFKVILLLPTLGCKVVAGGSPETSVPVY